MTEALVADFLAHFDDSRFPADFLRDYELLECLAQNEIGETLLIKDQQTGRRCVAKCYTHPLLLVHTTESELLKKLHHPGLPAYVAEYRNETMLCVVREFVPGRPLDQWVQGAPLPRGQSIAIVAQLCEILSYLHSQTPPIIHRDIKPQNIIVDEQGRVSLIDFGISRAYDETSQADTLCLGTRRYAAPEQYGFSQTDGRSDIFSLGILLCWLLTGSLDPQAAKKNIPDGWLSRVIHKCTAFAPQDRFKNAAQVRDALTGRALRRQVLVFFGVVIALLAGMLVYAHYAKMLPQPPAGITFKEPLIEQAVRLALAKDDGAEISEQELLSISELFVFGDKAAANEETFQVYARSFANSEGTVLRGSIQTLDDLTRLKNLRRVSLAYQNITDLSPLAGLADLESIDLRHNPIEDVAPLSQLISLDSIFLFDTRISDLTALRSCPHLSTVDVGYTLIESATALDGLDSLRVLMIRRAPLRSLEGIGTHRVLEEIYLSETQLLDLSPLLDLPRLQVVEVDENMRPAAQAIAEKASFKITYP